jgi:ubiquitin carboxyl-terminal hydrolase 34
VDYADKLRTCFKEVPDNLIFHLKRFEFDLADFSRRKVYDHFEFPSSIDVSAYHVDHLSDPSKPQKEDMFDLVGVLVHTGTCEHGHYYSYIRERPCAAASTAPTWVEFDDSNVTPFDPADIAYRAFGGMTDDTFNRIPKQYSAYMLFYQRRTAINEDQRHWVTSTDGQTLKVPMPQALEQEVDLSNELFTRQYCLFDFSHTKFARQLHAMSRTLNHGSCSEDHAQETRSLHIVLTHLSHIVWRHMSSDLFIETLQQLRRSVLLCSTCCNIVLKFLTTDEDAFVNLLLRCPHPKVRSQTRIFFIDCLNVLRDKEPAIYGLEASETDMEVDSSTPMEATLTDVTVKLRQMADETYISIRSWDDFYLTLTQVADMGTVETAALLNHGFLEFCLELFCMHVQPPFQEDHHDLWRILSKKVGIYNRLIGFASALLSRVDTRLRAIAPGENDDDRQSTLDRDSQRFPLTHRERQILFYWDNDLKAIAVLDKILEMFDPTKVDSFYPDNIVKSMLGWGDSQAQSNLTKTLIEGIKLEPVLCDAYIRVGLSFCEASPAVDNVTSVINAVARAIASPNRAEEERVPGGPAVLEFFAGLSKVHNEAIFQQKHRHIFVYWTMYKSRQYALPLLLHVLEGVRQGAQNLICGLYKSPEECPEELMVVRWKTLRDMVEEMARRIIYERDAGMLRSPLTPLISTYEFLMHQLLDLNQSEDPDMDPYRDGNDITRMFQWRTDIEPRLLSWPQDDVLSGDLYDQSEFGSESDMDEFHDIEN